MEINKNNLSGSKAEIFFKNKMEELGYKCERYKQWCDFIIQDKLKVEIKSCQLIRKWDFDKRNAPRFGRIDFTCKDSRNKLFKNNCWVCVIIHEKDQFIIYGFIKMQDLGKQRYFSLSKLYQIGLLSFDEWLNKIDEACL